MRSFFFFWYIFFMFLVLFIIGEARASTLAVIWEEKIRCFAIFYPSTIYYLLLFTIFIRRLVY